MATRKKRSKAATSTEQPAEPLRLPFSSFARKVSCIMGQPVTFIAAVVIVVGWAVLGPVFGFSDTWQLVINTGTTIITFLMVFLIQSSQNHDTYAIQLKLDELIRATRGAHNTLLDLEELEEEDLLILRNRYEKLASRARKKGRPETNSPGIKTY
jgi:low affinity Fe/Cu permease